MLTQNLFAMTSAKEGEASDLLDVFVPAPKALPADERTKFNLMVHGQNMYQELQRELAKALKEHRSLDAWSIRRELQDWA